MDEHNRTRTEAHWKDWRENGVLIGEMRAYLNTLIDILGSHKSELSESELKTYNRVTDYMGTLALLDIGGAA